MVESRLQFHLFSPVSKQKYGNLHLVCDCMSVCLPVCMHTCMHASTGADPGFVERGGRSGGPV